MDLLFLLLLIILIKMHAGNSHQISQENGQGFDHRNRSADVFSGILTTNQGSSKFMIQGDIAIKRTRNSLRCSKKSCLWSRSGGGLVYVPYTLSTNYTSDEKTIIRAAMDEVAVLTCIRFVPRNVEPNYLRIQPYDGCWSYVGRVGGAQDISLMKTGCLHRGIIQHELLHSLGFQHEQCRSDRDKYIRINWENISQDKERNFYKINTQNLVAPYDYLSVLHYGKFAFSNNAGKATLEPTGNPSTLIGQRIGLSSLDVVKINKIYQCSTCSFLLPDPHGGFSWDSKLYPNTSTCLWLIRVPEGKIFLQFESFNIQSSPSCGRGFMRAYDGPNTESPYLHPKTCGDLQPHGLVASGSLVRIEFFSRGTGVSFKARYDTVKCGHSMKDSAGNFSSPGFPAKYPNSLDCVWSLSAPPGNKIILRVRPFSLEPSLGCIYDYVLVRDGHKQKKHCGVIPDLEITSSSNSLLIHFHSDVSVQTDGFHAMYSFGKTHHGGKDIHYMVKSMWTPLLIQFRCFSHTHLLTGAYNPAHSHEISTMWVVLKNSVTLNVSLL